MGILTNIDKNMRQESANIIRKCKVSKYETDFRCGSEKICFWKVVSLVHHEQSPEHESVKFILGTAANVTVHLAN